LIYLCRHGETAYNRESRIQGQLDSTLTPLGRKQARATGACLAGLIPDPTGWRIVASPLERTRQTAAAIAERLGLPIELDARLMEVHVGAWQGQLHKTLLREHPELMDDRLWCFRAPGGETYDGMMVRIRSWYEEQPQDAKVICVSHGVAGRLMRALVLGLEPAAAMRQDIPQDAVYRLDAATVDRIACPEVA
jgi:broad specificity phosphatase PhoE